VKYALTQRRAFPTVPRCSGRRQAKEKGATWRSTVHGGGKGKQVTRSAFTLIEVMLVIVLLGLLAGATVFSLTETARRSSRADAIDQIRHADRMARAAARRIGEKYMLRFDLDEQRLWRVVQHRGDAEQASHRTDLPTRYRVDRMVVPSTPDSSGLLSAEVSAETHESGSVDIPYSTAGRSVSYAVRLEPRHASQQEDESEKKKTGSCWLVFAGLTGQMTVYHEKEAIDNLFSQRAIDGSDTD
jgi:prepilin-type N-terminal cleavage/methylation domain-containing protein